MSVLLHGYEVRKLGKVALMVEAEWWLPAGEGEGQGPAGDLECSVCVVLPKHVHFVVIEQIMFLGSCVVLYVIF